MIAPEILGRPRQLEATVTLESSGSESLLLLPDPTREQLRRTIVLRSALATQSVTRICSIHVDTSGVVDRSVSREHSKNAYHNLRRTLHRAEYTAVPENTHPIHVETSDRQPRIVSITRISFLSVEESEARASTQCIGPKIRFEPIRDDGSRSSLSFTSSDLTYGDMKSPSQDLHAAWALKRSIRRRTKGLFTSRKAGPSAQRNW